MLYKNLALWFISISVGSFLRALVASKLTLTKSSPACFFKAATSSAFSSKPE